MSQFVGLPATGETGRDSASGTEHLADGKQQVGACLGDSCVNATRDRWHWPAGQVGPMEKFHKIDSHDAGTNAPSSNCGCCHDCTLVFDDCCAEHSTAPQTIIVL